MAEEITEPTTADFEHKTFFTRALMLRRFFTIAITYPTNAVIKAFEFLSTHMMTIGLVVAILVSIGSAYHKLIGDKYAAIPITFFIEQKVYVEGRIHCCIQGNCLFIPLIGVELYDSNTCKF